MNKNDIKKENLFLISDDNWDELSDKIREHLHVGDFQDTSSGKWYCGKCGNVRYDKIGSGLVGLVEIGGKVLDSEWGWVRCECMKSPGDRVTDLKIREKRAFCFRNERDRDITFDNDNGSHPSISKIAKRYADNIEYCSKNGRGLILSGAVGCGKTHMAKEIANAVIDKNHRVRFGTVKYFYNEYMESKNRNDYLNSFYQNSLVIIDDLGSESGGLLDFLFDLINTLYETMTAFVITTNLSPEEMARNKEMKHERIYSRILERCNAITFSEGISERTKIMRRENQRFSESIGDNDEGDFSLLP